MSTYSVYIHTNKINGKRYIGVTRSKPEKRWANGEGYKNQPHFYSAIQKYGWDNFDHFILEVDSEELMFQLEKQYIAYYKTTDRRYGYNKSLGGESGAYFGKNSGTSEWYKDRYNRNKDVILERQHKRYKERREEIIARRRELYDKNRDEINAKERARRQERKEEYKAKYEKRKDRINAYKRAWRFAKKSKDIPPITPLW